MPCGRRAPTLSSVLFFFLGVCFSHRRIGRAQVDDPEESHSHKTEYSHPMLSIQYRTATLDQLIDYYLMLISSELMVVKMDMLYFPIVALHAFRGLRSIAWHVGREDIDNAAS